MFVLILKFDEKIDIHLQFFSKNYWSDIGVCVYVYFKPTIINHLYSPIGRLLSSGSSDPTTTCRSSVIPATSRVRSWTPVT